MPFPRPDVLRECICCIPLLARNLRSLPMTSASRITDSMTTPPTSSHMVLWEGVPAGSSPERMTNESYCNETYFICKTVGNLGKYSRKGTSITTSIMTH